MQDITIEIKRSEFAYKQISRFFEELIASGKLKTGDRIDPTSKLAQKFSVTPNTIQKSLALLTQKGMLTRSRKRGTFVNASALCRNLGLVFGFDDIFNPYNRFWGAIFKELKMQAEKKGWKCKPYLGLENNFDQVLQDIESDIAKGKLKSLIPLCYPASICKWLNEECPVPWSTLESTSECDYDAAINIGMQHLLENGRRKIGVISTMSPKDKQNVAVNSWNASGKICTVICNVKGRKSEHETVKRIFQSEGPKPDALFFLDDRACEGGIMALIEMGIKIPSKLAVLSFANKGVDIMSPVKISRVEFDPADFARATLNDLTSQVSGKNKIERIKIMGILKPGHSCGEG